MTRRGATATALALVAGLAGTATVATADHSSTEARAAGREQTTLLISKALDGGAPNGPSTHPVISSDRRYARLIAFESEASNLVANDTNDQKDVFVIPRTGTIDNIGTPWEGAATMLVSQGMGGQPADGPSFHASVSGDFRSPGRCIAFLSGATNLVPGDTNGKVDAFLVKRPGAAPVRVSLLPGNGESTADATDVSVSGDCSRVSFIVNRQVYTRKGNKTYHLRAPGLAADVQYAVGDSNALVFTARRGIHLSPNGIKRSKLVARGGRDPAFNDLKRRTLAYEKRRGGRVQIFYKDLGKRETIISDRRGALGNGHSLDPVIGNSGYYVTFESEASNLGVNALMRTGDHNGRIDSYLYTNVRDLTLVQSVHEKAVPLPGGGQNPSMSYYANYIVFDAVAPASERDGRHQIYMRYLGPV
jgi:TolB protein